MKYLYPRLARGAALQLVNQQQELALEELENSSSLSHPQATVNPVGGLRVPEAHLDRLRTDMRDLAREFGFPRPLGGRTAEFDRAFMPLLYNRMGIVPGDAGREEVWSFLSLVLVPELPVWRYPSRSEERILGMPRNTFRRLWWRAHILGVEANGFAYRLNEDQLVQIEERPTIGGDPRLARSLALAFEQIKADRPHVPQEALMREGAKRFTRITPFVDVYGLPDNALLKVCQEAMARAADALGVESSIGLEDNG